MERPKSLEDKGRFAGDILSIIGSRNNDSTSGSGHRSVRISLEKDHVTNLPPKRKEKHMAKKITVNMVLTAEDSIDGDITFNDAEEFIEAVNNGWLSGFFPALNVDIKAAKVSEV